MSSVILGKINYYIIIITAIISVLSTNFRQQANEIGQFAWRPSVILLTWYRVTTTTHLKISPCGCGDLSGWLGSRIGPHCHRVVVEVHWRGAQGWRFISWLAATFDHVGGSFNLLMAATGDVWIIPSFQIWDNGLHVEHIPCVITNCGQHPWAIPYLFSIAL